MWGSVKVLLLAVLETRTLLCVIQRACTSTMDEKGTPMEVNLLEKRKTKGKRHLFVCLDWKAESSDIVVERVDTRTFMPSHLAHHLSWAAD